MAEQFPIAQYTFSQIEFSFHSEATLLSKIVQSKDFSKLLAYFSNYNSFLSTLPSGDIAYEKILKATNGSAIIDNVISNSNFREAIYTSHLAACCSLFQKSSFFPDQLTKKELIPLINNMLSSHKNADANTLLNLAQGFHVLDCIRTMQILRCLGLVSIKTEDIRILGLGVGGGDKEVWLMHVMPVINQVSITKPSKGRDDKHAIQFDIKTENIIDAVIIDADPQQKDKFKHMATIEKPKIVCFNEYNDSALEQLPETQITRQMDPRNLVTAIRFDHRMFPEVDAFIKNIRASIADEADLILSIGSGQNIQEFKGRTEKIQEFFNCLTKLGMKPVIIKLHGKGDLRKQWETPNFGLPGTTTYQILYCRLIKSKIK